MDIGRQTAEALSDRCLRWCVMYDRNLAGGQDFFMPKRRIGNEKIFRRAF